VELTTSRAKFSTQIKRLVQICTYLFLRKLEWFWFWFLFHKKIGTLGPVLEKIKFRFQFWFWKSDPVLVLVLGNTRKVQFYQIVHSSSSVSVW
jgi:hypothetical protein